MKKRIKKERPYKQIELFTEIEETNDNKNSVIEKISKINPLEITPIQAINILYELKQDINKNVNILRKCHKNF